MSDKFGWQEKIRRLQQMKSDLPKVLANTALTFFNREFEKSEWDNVSWPDRKDKNNKRHLLVQSGRLRNELNNSVKRADWSKVQLIIANLPYAEIQNYGGTIDKKAGTITTRHRTDSKGDLLKQKGNSNLLVFAGKKHKRVRHTVNLYDAHTITIPQRKFIGNSPLLNALLRKKFESALKPVFRK